MGSLHLGILFILGIGVFGGILSGLIFQKLKIPQVIGYIVIGIIIGRTGLKIIDAQTIEMFRIFNFFALGIIGFLVGGELFMETFKKYGKQFFGIMLGEGVLSFGLVTTLTSLMMYLLTGNTVQSIAVGLIFGAVSSATDPASTLDVLWEYRAAGILTTTIIAIVALDDALAMTLYGISSGISQILIGESASLTFELLRAIREIFGAILLGVGGGLLLNFLLRLSGNREKVIAFAIAIILIIISLAQMLKMDIIFASMSMGLVVRNIASKRSKGLFELVRSFSIPIYVFFFVLVGARLKITAMPWWMWVMVGIYCAGRNSGKIIGAWMGGKLTRADKVVRRYTGMGLFAQGGVTIGLAIIASQHLAEFYIIEGISLGETIVFIITATTLVFQVTGPHMVKLALKLSKEMLKNVTREDIIASKTVYNKMTAEIILLKENDPVKTVLDVYSENEYLIYPVINRKNKFMGIISFENIKNILTSQDIWEWIVAKDLATESPGVLKKDMPLKEALELMNQIGVEQLPVLDENDNVVGILDKREVIRSIDKEIVAMKSTT